MWRLVFACLFAASAALSQPQTLSRDEARQAAALAVQRGAPLVALEITDTLLQVDPTDSQALIVASQAHRSLGDNSKALDFARRAWRASEDPRQRYQAALVRAQALSSAGQRSRAQLWLRRAAQIAPSDREKAAAVRDFRYVRGRNPWRTTLRFGVQPSSNVNNGSRNDSFAVGALDFALSGDARALSGVEYSLGIETRVTRPLGQRTAVRFGARVDANRYTLSDDARKQAPNADPADYAFTQAELSFGLRHAKDPRQGAFDLEATIGQNWYGGDLLSDYADLQASQSFKLGARSTGFTAVRLSWQDRKDNPARSSRGGELSFGWSKRFENRNRLTVVVSREVVQADSDQAAFSGTGLRFGLDLGEPILSARASISAGFERRDYKSGIFGLPRQDDRSQLGLNLFFPDQNLYGFAPTLDLTWDRTDSSQALYETEEFGLRIGLKSAF